jgi:hypothetical protein
MRRHEIASRLARRVAWEIYRSDESDNFILFRRHMMRRLRISTVFGHGAVQQ